MLNACMLANTSLLVLRSSGFERGRLYTQFSTLSTIEKFLLCVHALRLYHGNPAVKKYPRSKQNPSNGIIFCEPILFSFPEQFSSGCQPKISSGCQHKNQAPTTSQYIPIRQRREGMWLGDTIRSRLWWYPFALVLSCGWLICLVLWGDHAFQFVDVIVPVVSIFVLHRPHVLPVCLVCVHTFHHAFVPSSVEPLRHCASDV